MSAGILVLSDREWVLSKTVTLSLVTFIVKGSMFFLHLLNWELIGDPATKIH